MPSPGPITTWENLANQRIETLTYSISAAPQYFEIYLPLPSLLPVIEPLMPTVALSEHVLVDVRYEAFITHKAPSINTAGFCAAELGFYTFSPPPAGPTNLDVVVPVLDPLAQPLVAEAYDPTGLPIGGVNYPIWSKAAIDPLIATVYANPNDNPQPLWAMAFVQVNGSLIGDTVTIIHHIHWDFADTGKLLRPTIGERPW